MAYLLTRGSVFILRQKSSDIAEAEQESAAPIMDHPKAKGKKHGA